MKSVLEYLKYIGIFFLALIVTSIILSLINLTGINPEIIRKIAFVFTLLIIFIISLLSTSKTVEKGFVRGLKLSIILIIIMLIINLICFQSKMSFIRVIYYLILISMGTLGGAIGKNFKIKRKSGK